MSVIKRKKNKKNYFTQETEDAIILYNNTTNEGKKNRIYREQIHHAFFKLTESIIHTFKFYYTEVDKITDLQYEVISFLISKIHLFDPSKGAKAYSYFGTIAKRYLILYNNNNYKKLQDKDNLDNITENIDHSYSIEKTSIDELSLFIDEYVNYYSKNLYYYFPKKNDAKIVDVILDLFRNRENIDIFNKKALYIHIREVVDVKTPKITRIANKMYNLFKKHYEFYLNNGFVDFNRN